MVGLVDGEEPRVGRAALIKALRPLLAALACDFDVRDCDAPSGFKPQIFKLHVTGHFAQSFAM